MLTNVSRKPVVTWRDLRNGFGYRLPYGIDNKVNDQGTSFLRKGVTYKDLENCTKGYLSEYKSQFEQLTDAQKRMYITNNAAISTIVHPISSFTLTPSSEVGHFTTYGTYTGGTPFKFIADPMSEMKEIVWFTFMADQSLHNCSVTWDKLDLVATHTTAVPTNASVSLQGQILVRRVGTTATIGRGMIPNNVISTDSTYRSIDVTMPTTFTSVKKGAVYEVVISVYTTVFYKSEIDIPSVTAELPLNPILPGLTTTTITFYSKDVTLSLESNNKCVTYDLVKANTQATVPVYVSIINDMVSGSDAGRVLFTYYYKTTSDGVWHSKHALDQNWGSIPTSDRYATLQVPINPVDEDISADYLVLDLKWSTVNKDVTYTIYFDNDVVHSSKSGRYVGATIKYGDSNTTTRLYREVVKQMTRIYVRFDY